MIQRYKPLRRTAIKRKIRPSVVVVRGYREICHGQAWQDRRSEVCERVGGYCEGHSKRGLVRWAPLHDTYDEQGDLIASAGHAHHKRGRGMGGGFRDDSLKNMMWLCSECHNTEHLPKKAVPKKPVCLSDHTTNESSS